MIILNETLLELLHNITYLTAQSQYGDEFSTSDLLEMLDSEDHEVTLTHLEDLISLGFVERHDSYLGYDLSLTCQSFDFLTSEFHNKICEFSNNSTLH